MSYHSVGGVDPLKTIQAVSEIAFDPALPKIIDHVLELNRLEQSRTPGAPKARGIGLGYIEQPLATYVWVRKNPGAAFLAGAIILAIPFLIGLSMRRSPRSSP